MTNKIVLRRGAVDYLPWLDVGELAFSTDTHSLFVGSSTGNVAITQIGDTTHIGFDPEDISDQVITGASYFVLANRTGTFLLLMFKNGLLQSPYLYIADIDFLGVTATFGVTTGDELVAVKVVRV